MKLRNTSWPWLLALALLPLCWLWPSVFGGHTFVPFDPVQFPPASLTLGADELAAAREGSDLDVTEVWPWLLPEMEVAQGEVARGHWPSWNPHARTGAPLHESGVHGVLYPPHWLWLFGGDPKARLVWLVWISLALAGLFTFGLLRKVALSRPAAALGAATFQLSGTMMANAYFWTRLPGLAWLPGLLLALLCLGEGERTRRAPFVAVAVCLAMPWYAGFPPYATAGTLIALLFTTRLLLERLAREGSPATKHLLRRYASALLAGVLLTMPQVLPSFWFYAAESARSAAPGINMAAGARFEWYGLLAYLIPDAFGHPHLAAELPAYLNPLCYLWGNLTDAAGQAANPQFNFTEYSVFFGAAGLLLAGYGALRSRGHMRGFAVVTLALLFGLALFVPVLNLVYYLPVVGNVAPMRWLAPATLFLAWLAAIGFDRLMVTERRGVGWLATAALVLAGLVAWLATWPRTWRGADPQWPATAIAERFGLSTAQVHEHFGYGGPGGRDLYAAATDQLAAAGSTAAVWVLLCGLALAGLALLHRTRARPCALALLPLLAVIQLGSRGAVLLTGHPLPRGTDTAVHAFLRAEAERHAADGGFTIARGGSGKQIPSQLPPGQLMAPGIRDLHFYAHFDARSIEPIRAAIVTALGEERGRLWGEQNPNRGYLQRTLPDEVLEHPVFDLLGVRYVLATQPLQHAGRLVDTGFAPRRGAFYVYERTHLLPRAFTVPAVRAFASDEEVLAAMADPAIRFDREALVGPDVAAVETVGDGPMRTTTFVRDEPSVVELDIGAGAAPWLVLTDTFFSGWSATVDGKPVAIERCNHSQRLVRLPADACRVRFARSPPLLWPGFLLFAIAILIVLRVRTSSGETWRVETTE